MNAGIQLDHALRDFQLDLLLQGARLDPLQQIERIGGQVVIAAVQELQFELDAHGKRRRRRKRQNSQLCLLSGFHFLNSLMRAHSLRSGSRPDAWRSARAIPTRSALRPIAAQYRQAYAGIDARPESAPGWLR